ncbi:MAG: hypothetical protein K6A44_03240 [bacterium]|nr:hypothetical protein [bacterium]
MANLQMDTKLNSDLSYAVPILNDENNNIYLAKLIENKLTEIIDEDMRTSQPIFINIKKGFIHKIAYKLVSNPKERILIGVSGESASGKSTLTSKVLDICLTEKHKSLATLITSDNYYKDASDKLREAGSYEALFDSGFNLDEPQAVDLDLLRGDLKRIKSGEVIFTPEYNFFTIESIPRKIRKAPAKIILTEGLFVLEEKLRELLDISIYVHTPADIIKKRWYKRAITRGKEGKAADMLFGIVNAGAVKYIRPYAKEADIVISGITSEDYIRDVVAKIKDAIRSCLF